MKDDRRMLQSEEANSKGFKISPNSYARKYLLVANNITHSFAMGWFHEGTAEPAAHR